MSIKGQGHSFTLVKVHSDFKVKCLTFGLYTQVSDSGPLGPLVYVRGKVRTGELFCMQTGLVNSVALGTAKTIEFWLFQVQ